MLRHGLLIWKEVGGMEYLFVYDGNGWYLKLTNAEQITDYHKKTAAKKYESAISLYFKMVQQKKTPYEYLEAMDGMERIKMMMSTDFKYIQCAVALAEKQEGTFLDGLRMLLMETGMNELETIREYGAVYINPAGGHTHGIEYTQFCRRKELIFPCYTVDDIRIEQFKGGQHWYAYVGDMQVRDGDSLKWDTKPEARAAAERIVRGNQA